MRPLYQTSEATEATVELIKTLLEANALQLILVAPVLVVAFLMVTSILAYLRSRAERQDRHVAAAGDDKIIYRLIDISERQLEINERQATNAEQTNKTNSELVVAIHTLNQTQQQTREMHTLNRESILETATRLDRLDKNTVEWHKVNNASLNELATKVETLENIIDDFKTGIQALVTASQNAVGSAEFATVTQQISAQINVLTEEGRETSVQILEAIRKLQPDPPTPTNEAQSPQPRKPLDADAARHDATVDSSGEAA